ncbi:Far upstream element-binding protein 3, partial [Halocaridina rubra]
GPGGPGQNGNTNLAPQGWGNAYQQWSQGHPNDPTKQVADANHAAWAAYYSQFYTGQSQQGNAPPNAHAQPNANQPPSGPGAGGQSDYSAQWVDYYRSMGLHREAEGILELQAKALKGGGPSGQTPNATPQQGGGGQPAAPGGSVGGGAPAQDYSQQWIEYYRAQGMHADADKIETQLKAGKGGVGGTPAVPNAPHQLGAAPGGPAAAAAAAAAAVNGQAPGQQSGGGMNDYTQQWIEYYRSQGMHADADKIEHNFKAAKGGAGGPPGGGPVTPMYNASFNQGY